MISNSRITKLTSIILTILLLSAIAAPVSASATILTHKEKRNLDIPNYVLPIKNFDMKPYMVKKTLADITFLKFCFRDDTCWNSLDAETQSYIYKGIPKTIDDIIFNSTDKKKDDICNRHHNLCNLDKKGWVGTESPTIGILHLSYDNTQTSKISVKISYNPQKIILYDHIYTFQENNKPNELVLLDKTFSLSTLSEDKRKLIDLIVNIIDTGNQNDKVMLIISAATTIGGSISTIISCAGTVITVGTLSPSCYFSIGLTSTGIVSLVSGINSHHQNEMLVNKYTDQLKLFNDINIKYDL